MDLITNQFIPSQFPAIINDKGPNFVAFVKAYYEWLEQSGNPLYYSRNFTNFSDVDNTLDQFLIHFKNEFMANIPYGTVVDKRLLIKHITDLYAAKGSKRGYALLFRLIFNENIDLYLPSSSIFKPSDNTWYIPRYIEVTYSPILQNLVGTLIYAASTGATALVENSFTISLSNKIIYVLTLSDIDGNFPYGDFILSHDVPSLNLNNAPQIVGSLSSVSLQNGGIFFNVGDLVNIAGSGQGALGRVASITSQNGKIVFNLVNGGFGYSLNPTISVTGGGGAGATFQVGALTNETVMTLNLDVVNNYYNTVLDIASSGYILKISGTTGTFSVSEVVNATANGVALDFAYISGNNLTIGETLTNSSLSIAGLTVVSVDNPNFVNLTGTDPNLLNANVKGGVYLVGGTSGSIIYVNSVFPKTTYQANGTVTAANSTQLTINNANGYFLPTSNVHGQTSGAYALLANTIRQTNWIFPANPGNTNLDTALSTGLTYFTEVVGTISKLTAENPGNGYISNATISIVEPLVYQLQIPDGGGGYWGGDANITATALNANGIMTAINIVQSGYGFVPNEPLTITSNNNAYVASGAAVVDGTGLSQGYWKNEKSFLSDTTQRLQDSYYYQEFSYEIIAPRMLNTYQQLVANLVHPVGFQLFGRYREVDEQSSEALGPYYQINQTTGASNTYSNSGTNTLILPLSVGYGTGNTYVTPNFIGVVNSQVQPF